MTSGQAPNLAMAARHVLSKRQLAGIRASDHVADAVSRGAAGAARRARSPGCRVCHVVFQTPLGTRAAKATDDRGRFDDESR
jgi:hypothetical protein